MGYWVEAMKYSDGKWDSIGPFDIEGPDLIKTVMVHKLKPAEVRTITWPPDPNKTKNIPKKKIKMGPMPIGRFKFIATYYKNYSFFSGAEKPQKAYSREFTIVK